MAKQLRMTAQSKVNIEVAKSAVLEKNPSGGYFVLLNGANGSCHIENAEGKIAYSSMSIAKDAVKKHNSSLEPKLSPTI